MDCHAVSGNENAGAVVPEATMYKNFLVRIIAEERKELRHLFIARRRPPAHRQVHKAHAERFGFLAFPLEFVAVFAAQIHYRRDAQTFQLGEPVFLRLCAAKKNVVDFSCVVNSCDVQFLPVNWLNFC